MTIRAKRIATWMTAAAVTTIATVSVANAGAFALREQSAYGQGMAFAGVAAGGSLSTSFWNPATLSMMDGIFGAETVVNLFSVTSDITTDQANTTVEVAPGTFLPLASVFGANAADGDSNDLGQGAITPASYLAYRLNDQLVFGLSTTAPYGLVTDNEIGYPGQVYSLTSEVFSINVAPMVSYQLNDWLSLGAGAQVQYFSTRLTRADGATLDANIVELEGDNIGFGFTAGLTITPMEGTSVGLGYRSGVSHDLEGDLNWVGLPGGTAPITSDLELPDVASLGVRQQFTDQFLLGGTVEWTQWSKFESFPVLFENGTEASVLHFNYDDGWFFSLGGEYAYSEALSFRVGVGYEMSPIDDISRRPSLPDGDRIALSAGASYNIDDRLGMDLAYIYYHTDEEVISIDPTSPEYVGVVYNGTADGQVHIISAGFKLKFGAAPVVIDEGIVRKY